MGTDDGIMLNQSTTADSKVVVFSYRSGKALIEALKNMFTSSEFMNALPNSPDTDQTTHVSLKAISQAR